MQGSMKLVAGVAAAIFTVAVIGILAGTSQAATTGCNDMRWVNGMSPAVNKAVSAFTLASNGSLYAGESKLRSARVSAYQAGSPCSTLLKGAQRSWMRGVNIALSGFDLAQDGNYGAAIPKIRSASQHIRTATDYLTAYNA